MRRQGQVGIVEFRVERVNREMPVIDPQLRRNIAAARRDQQQQGRADPGAAIGFADHGVAREAAPPVLLGSVQVQLPQRPGHALVCLVQVRVGGERRLIMLSGSARIVLLAQHIGKIDSSDRVAGMMLHRLQIGSAGG